MSGAASPPTPTPGPGPVPAMTDADRELEKLLNREASALNREMECERILKAFKLNPYELLDIDENATPEAIKKRYRQLSLFIHPDKTSHARAPEAFDLLKKAESELSDEKKRAEIDAVVIQARMLLLKSLSLPINIDDDDARLRALVPPLRVQLRARSKELFIDEEVRRRKAIKMNLANEGLEAKRKEEEMVAKKRKADDEKVWEETREQRVGSWRTFAGNKKKKQKIKPAILG
ncbi:hypothetical protein EW145_g3432 [Phellinidium pouzarii]|uniref:J domain-containing protein n=1 Tax=Phellinidium pouzarii TaxID=167371 RepID=A0A4S4L7E4_9AGAM|nr:hypothetical protein EW145_g3432 [Phellinidium pouzarii]